jgi:hypothetical protein
VPPSGTIPELPYVAKLQDKPSPSNNRIVAHKFLNQHCVLASALESILMVLAPKMALQHNHTDSGRQSDRRISTLCANSRHHTIFASGLASLRAQSIKS